MLAVCKRDFGLTLLKKKDKSAIKKGFSTNARQNCGKNRQNIILQNIIDILTKYQLDRYRISISDIYQMISIKATLVPRYHSKKSYPLGFPGI